MSENRRKLQKQLTRAAILDAAGEVYGERGFGATTAEIARRADVSHGSVFAHFPTLNHLIECLIGQFEAAIGKQLHDLAESGAGSRQLLEAHLSAIERHEKLYRRLITDTALLPDGAQNAMLAIQSIAAHHFGAVMRCEIEKGTVKEVPVHLLFNSWIGLVHYYLQNGDWFSPGDSVIKKCGPELVEAFLQLIHA